MLMNDPYFDFLYQKVKKDNTNVGLLRELYEKDFYSILPNDDNRGVDGLAFRDEFIELKGPQASSFVPKGPCRVLEMLIGLAYRLEFELAQSQYERPPKYWFWKLIDNLGLGRITWSPPSTLNHINSVITKMLDRQYNYYGRGGLFPLRTPTQDQRMVEIWYQMTAWIIENYPIF